MDAITAFSVSLLFGFLQIRLRYSTFAFRALWRNLSFRPSFLQLLIPTVCYTPAYLHWSAPLLKPLTIFSFPPESPFGPRQSRFLTTASLILVAHKSEMNNVLNMQMGVRLISIFCRLIMRMKRISVKRWYGCLGGTVCRHLWPQSLINIFNLRANKREQA